MINQKFLEEPQFRDFLFMDSFSWMNHVKDISRKFPIQSRVLFFDTLIRFHYLYNLPRKTNFEVIQF